MTTDNCFDVIFYSRSSVFIRAHLWLILNLACGVSRHECQHGELNEE